MLCIENWGPGFCPGVEYHLFCYFIITLVITSGIIQYYYLLDSRITGISDKVNPFKVKEFGSLS
jgi:hypothetical protein